MKYPVILFSTLILFSCIRPNEADLIVHHAKIYSVDEDSTVYEAMAIKDGKIIDMGKENQILNKYSSDNIVDAKLAPIYPGFIDAHCHFIGYGLSLQQVDLRGTKSFNEVVERCKSFDEQNNPKWLTGRGWDNTKWENPEFPGKEELDQLFPNKPVLIRRIDGHAALANQVALDIAGITPETKIDGGYIEIKDGALTGILVDNAADLVLNIIPEPTEIDKKKAIIDAQRNCFEVGLTTVDDAGLNKSDVQLLEKLESSGELLMNIYVMLSDNEENYGYYIDTVGSPYRSEKINVAAFKFYGDGALGSRGACLLMPYSDRDSVVGMLLSAPEHFKEKAQLVYDHGFQMCTHCIGDSAARLILKTYGEVLGGVNDKRWRIEHAQVIHPNDFHYFRDFTVIPSVQPTHATSDMVWAVLRLGQLRVKDSYAYQKLLQENGLIALGTDFPIENINPIETFYAAVARKNTQGLPKNGFQIENALTRWEALQGMTIWAALSNFEDNEKGTLEVGKRADFVILSNDILTAPEDEILSTSVIATYISGKEVYGR